VSLPKIFPQKIHLQHITDQSHQSVKHHEAGQKFFQQFFQPVRMDDTQKNRVKIFSGNFPGHAPANPRGKVAK